MTGKLNQKAFPLLGNVIEAIAKDKADFAAYRYIEMLKAGRMIY